ncbi:hypothetical protein J437_LFUL012201 [Ladona fulva]|uniref:Histone-lysine N-methyltransferase SETMAR n=1 Tax=Ladona fulva TaxID=123851 RepID=A0A8K0KPJ3_LADFU|nr:hypothetical protein J437_LFUL012201 [Ladona fulva]
MLTRGVYWLHDNAHPHLSHGLSHQVHLDSFGWDVLNHPPYSRLGAFRLSSFHLPQAHMGGIKFSTDEHVQKVGEGARRRVLRGGHKKLAPRATCIERDGDYVEK